MLLLKLLVITSCVCIAFQDFRERAVTWLFFPTLAILLTSQYLLTSTIDQYYPFILANLLLVSGILLILFLYTRYISKTKFLNVSIGLGDILFFYAFALGFPTLTFIVLFSGSILFSALCFFIYKKQGPIATVPLAGLMGCFLIVVFLASFFPKTPSLYLL